MIIRHIFPFSLPAGQSKQKRGRGAPGNGTTSFGSLPSNFFYFLFFGCYDFCSSSIFFIFFKIFFYFSSLILKIFSFFFCVLAFGAQPKVGIRRFMGQILVLRADSVFCGVVIRFGVCLLVVACLMSFCVYVYFVHTIVMLLHLGEDAEGLSVFEFVFGPFAKLLYVFVVGEESVDEFYGVDDALV